MVHLFNCGGKNIIIIIFSGGKELKLTSFSSTGGNCYRVKMNFFVGEKGLTLFCKSNIKSVFLTTKNGCIISLTPEDL